jgi:hypothetical protein
MNTFRFALLKSVALLGFTTAALALTVTEEVNPAYVQKHSEELSVKVVRREDGRIDFTVIRNLPQQKYLVARLTIRQGDKIIAETSIPLFAKKNANTFHLSISPDHIATSEFELGESFFAENGDNPVPLPGTVNYHFKLSKFVPAGMLKSARRK